jgi:hypothetical protein
MSLVLRSESAIENAILEYLAMTGVGFFWKNVMGGFFDGVRFRKQANPFAINGVPDILGYLYSSGRMVALEVKTATGRTSPAQDAFIGKASQAGVVCAVVRSPLEAFQVLQAHGVDVQAPDDALATWKSRNG